MTVNSSEDTYVKQDAPTATNGSSSQIFIMEGSNNDRFIYLKFSVSGLSGKTVDSVKLRLKENTGCSEGDQNFNVYRVGTTSWNESTLCWNNKPTNDTTSLGSYDGYLLGDGEVIDIVLDRTYITEDGTYSLVLKPNGSCTNDSTFFSRLIIGNVSTTSSF